METAEITKLKDWLKEQAKTNPIQRPFYYQVVDKIDELIEEGKTKTVFVAETRGGKHKIEVIYYPFSEYIKYEISERTNGKYTGSMSCKNKDTAITKLNELIDGSRRYDDINYIVKEDLLTK